MQGAGAEFLEASRARHGRRRCERAQRATCEQCGQRVRVGAASRRTFVRRREQGGYRERVRRHEQEGESGSHEEEVVDGRKQKLRKKMSTL